jgi:branched-chain amino acid transport system permease protein
VRAMSQKAIKLLGGNRPVDKNNIITISIVVGLFAVIEVLKGMGHISNLLSGLLVPICMYITLAVSLNLVVGILGELSLGHAGFMCVGAYASALFSLVTKDAIPMMWLRFLLAFLIGGAVAAIFGLLIGIPVLRLKGDYLAIVTLAFGEIIKNLVTILHLGVDKHGLHFSTESVAALRLADDGKILIKGALGITGVPKSSTFEIGFVIVMITLLVSLNLVRSAKGRAIMAIRDNRIAAESVGINITTYKLFVFSLSAFFAGLAGVLYSHNLATLTANTNNFGYNMSISILLLVVLGGVGSIRGSVIAAIILTALPELLRGLSDYRMLIYSILLIVIMLFNASPKLVALRERFSPKNLIKRKKAQKEVQANV